MKGKNKEKIHDSSQKEKQYNPAERDEKLLRIDRLDLNFDLRLKFF